MDERRAGVLTEHDLEKIKQVTNCCPHGMTAEDIFRLRGFLDWWDEAKSTVGGYAIKTFVTLVIAIAILVAWVLNHGGPKA